MLKFNYIMLRLWFTVYSSVASMF